MPTPYEILVRARDEASATLKNVNAALDQIDGTAQKTNASFAKAGESVAKSTENSKRIGEGLQRSLVIAQSSLDVIAPSLAKLSPEFDAATRAAQQFAGALSLGMSFGPWGIAITAIVTGLGLLIGKFQEARAEIAQQAAQEAADLIRPFQDAAAAIEKLRPQTDPLQGLASSIPITTAELRELASVSDAVAERLERLNTTNQGITVLTSRLEQLDVKLRNLQADAAQQMATKGFVDPQTEADIQDTTNWIRVYSQALIDARAAQTELNGQIKSAADGLRLQTGALGEAIPAWDRYAASISDAQILLGGFASTNVGFAGIPEWDRAGVSVGEVNSQLHETYQISTDIDTAQQQINKSLGLGLSPAEQLVWNFQQGQKALEAQRAAAEKLKSTLMGMIDKALTPSAVTDKDMAAAAKGLQTPAHWDEFARRAEAVAKNGANPEMYKGFADQLKGLGMTAEQAAASFRDFSLFADPKNLNLIDWAPLTADVSHQIDMLIGRANVARQAFEEVWAALSPQKKADLASALDLDPSAANNVNKVFEAFSGQTAQNGVKTTDDIAGNIKLIDGAHTATIGAIKSNSFDANMEEILGDLDKIPAEADVVVTLHYNNAGSGGTSGGITTPAPNQTPTPGGNPASQASGGYGISQGHELFMTDPGEGYWFSGSNWQVPPPRTSGRSLSSPPKPFDPTDFVLDVSSLGYAGYGGTLRNENGRGTYIDKYGQEFHFNFPNVTSFSDLLRQVRAYAASAGIGP